MTTTRLRKHALHATSHGSRAEAEAAVNAYAAAIQAAMGPNRWQRIAIRYTKTPMYRYTIGWTENHPRAAWATSGILAAVEAAAYLVWK